MPGVASSRCNGTPAPQSQRRRYNDPVPGVASSRHEFCIKSRGRESRCLHGVVLELIKQRSATHRELPQQVFGLAAEAASPVTHRQPTSHSYVVFAHRLCNVVRIVSAGLWGEALTSPARVEVFMLLASRQVDQHAQCQPAFAGLLAIALRSAPIDGDLP